MNVDAWNEARTRRELAAAGLVGYIRGLLLMDAIPKDHRMEVVDAIGRYSEANNALKAALRDDKDAA